MESTASFVIWDYIVFGLVMTISVGIGVYHACTGNKQRTALEYHLGNRKMRTLPVVVSVLVTTQSSILMLGIPAEAYMYGIMVAWTGVSFCLAHLLAARFIVPLLHSLNIATIHEYYQLRYRGKAVRLFTSTCNILLNVIYMGIVAFGQAVSMENVTGIPTWLSILLITAAAVVYTSIGGIKAVIWTDVFQCVVMFVGILSVIIKGTLEAGGASTVWDVNAKTNRLDAFDISVNPYVQYTVWNAIIGATLKLSFSVAKQSAVQRMNTCETEKQAKTVFMLAGPAFIVTISLASAEGLVAYAYFVKKGCDPIKSKAVSNPNQMMPFMVVDMFKDYPGLPGLFLAAVASASLSTLSSCLSSMASITQFDLIQPHFRKVKDRSGTQLSKLSVFVYGGLAVGVAFLVASFSGSIFAIANSLISLFSVPLVGLFIYSAFFPSATTAGAIIGGSVGAGLIGWINIGSISARKRDLSPLESAPIDQCISQLNSTFTQNYTTTTVSTISTTQFSMQGLEYVYHLSSYWYDAIGIIGLLIVAFIVSFVINSFFKQYRVNPDPRYVLSFGERVCPCLPSKARKIICCGEKIDKGRKQACKAKILVESKDKDKEMMEVGVHM